MLPPLRECMDDIPALVGHFVQKYAMRMGKTITSIPKSTLSALRNWKWPDHIREFENFIERSVILTNGSVLEASSQRPKRGCGPPGTETDHPSVKNERDRN